MSKSETKIDPERHYQVRLRRVVKRGRIHLRPGEDLTLKGKVVEALIDDIAEYRLVAK